MLSQNLVPQIWSIEGILQFEWRISLLAVRRKVASGERSRTVDSVRPSAANGARFDTSLPMTPGPTTFTG